MRSDSTLQQSDKRVIVTCYYFANFNYAIKLKGRNADFSVSNFWHYPFCEQQVASVKSHEAMRLSQVRSKL